MVDRIDTLEKLKALVQADKNEREMLDYKKEVELSDDLEMAKDIASFANAYGGVILIGVDERRNDVPVTIVGVEKSLIRKIELAYDNAVRDKLSPRVAASCDTIELNETMGVLAVHVEPHISGMVGVRMPAHNNKQNEVESWRFPIRKGKNGVDHRPEQLPFAADPKLRRIVILLNRVERDLKNRPDTSLRLETKSDHGLKPVGIRVNQDGNVVNIQVKRLSNPTSVDEWAIVPLDAIDRVWRGDPCNWTIQIDGYLMRGAGAPKGYVSFVPSDPLAALKGIKDGG